MKKIVYFIFGESTLVTCSTVTGEIFVFYHPELFSVIKSEKQVGKIVIPKANENLFKAIEQYRSVTKLITLGEIYKMM